MAEPTTITITELAKPRQLMQAWRQLNLDKESDFDAMNVRGILRDVRAWCELAGLDFMQEVREITPCAQ